MKALKMDMNRMDIHKTAIIDPKAQLADGVTVGAYTVIGPEVTIGEDVKIAHHCVIGGKTEIGRGTQIFSGAMLGSPPQDKKYRLSDQVSLTIGERNIIREYVTINTGTPDGGGKTVIGSHNLLMAYAHVAHDCIVGNNCVLANNGTLAGHVTMEDGAVIGGLCGVHQFVRLGRLSITGGCSKVVQDIPPFAMCDGHPAKLYNLNIVGLRRAKVSPGAVQYLKQAFKILFHSGLSKTHAIARIEQEIPACKEVEHLIFFAKTTKRGLCR